VVLLGSLCCGVLLSSYFGLFFANLSGLVLSLFCYFSAPSSLNNDLVGKVLPGSGLPCVQPRRQHVSSYTITPFLGKTCTLRAYNGI
jgi:hypothetical protein